MEWISVKDRLPDKAMNIFGWCILRFAFTGYYTKKGGFTIGGSKITVTYWMPVIPPGEE